MVNLSGCLFALTALTIDQQSFEGRESKSDSISLISSPYQSVHSETNESEIQLLGCLLL